MSVWNTPAAERVTAHERAAVQDDLSDALAEAELELGEPDGCSP